MKTAIRSLAGFCIVTAILVATAVHSQLIMLAASLYMVYVIVAALSLRMRVHFFTRELQAVMLTASLFSLLLILAGAILVIRVPLSTNAAIGMENHFLFCDWLPSLLRSPKWIGMIGPPPQAVISLRTGGNTMKLFPPLGWSRSSVPTMVVLIVIVVPTGPFWLIRMKLVMPGRCKRCDYDLTGNISGVCPECGQAFEKPA